MSSLQRATAITGNTLTAGGRGKPSLVRVILGGITIGNIKRKQRSEKGTSAYGGFPNTKVWDMRKEMMKCSDQSIVCTLVFL